MAKSIVVLGTQWGDEGKGKIVDLLTGQVQAVARFQGGHTFFKTSGCVDLCASVRGLC